MTDVRRCTSRPPYTIDLLCLNREVGQAEVGKIIRFIRGKSIVVFHCSAGLLQDFCNLLYFSNPRMVQ